MGLQAQNSCLYTYARLVYVQFEKRYKVFSDELSIKHFFVVVDDDTRLPCTKQIYVFAG